MIREQIRKLVGHRAKVEHPADPQHGDYSTNIALVKKIDPRKIVEKLKDNKMFEKVTVVKPGFINFYLSREFLAKQVMKIKIPNIGRGKKIQVEFISANPTGPLHIGNGRGAFFGDTLANVLEKVGYKVKREYYINDVGKQVEDLEKGLYKGERRTAKEIQEANQKFITKILKIKFDRWFSEKSLYEQSKVEKIKKELKEHLYEKDDAVWFKDNVLIKKTGEPSYFLSDIAYHKDKFERGFDKLINIWGADHAGHVERMKVAMEDLGYDKDRLDILITQMVRLKKGKLSKRLGRIITLGSLVDEVGLDACRFFYLMKSLDTQMEFDLDLAREQSEKNPVYYVQYAHARIQSILAKLKTQNVKRKTTTQNLKLKHLAELNLVRQLIRYPEVVEDIAKSYQVQKLPHYALDLAKTFHHFYKCCRVIGGGKTRLKLVKQTKRILKEILELMGIKAPEKM